MRARDRTCRIPHCNRAAPDCQIDHNVERQHGGATRPTNLGPLCHRHHRRKTRRIWGLQQTGDGPFEIDSPLGATYVVEPEPVDDPWHLPDDLWDWTDHAEWAAEHDLPPPEPHWATAIDARRTRFRHTETTTEQQ